MALELVLSALTARGCNPRRSGAGWSSRCPSHDDSSPSLSVSAGQDGRVLLHCFSGCAVPDIVAALGLSLRDLAPEDHDRRRSTKPQVTATYDYRRADGSLAYQVVRYAPKGFRQRRRNPDGSGWRWSLAGLDPADRSLPYKLPEVLEAISAGQAVYVCEGEKDAEALWAQGIPATTNAAGAGRWTAAHARWLRGAAGVTVVADRDDVGRDHARQVVQSLAGVGIGTVEVLVAGCSCPCKDASDAIRAHGDAWQSVLVPLAESPREGVASVANVATCGVTCENAVTTASPLRRQTSLVATPEPTVDLGSLGLLGTYARALAATYQVSEGFGLAVALGVAGLPAGLSTTVEVHDQWREPCVLQVLVVAPPSERKTPLLNAAMAGIYKAERELRAERADEIRAAKARRSELERRKREAGKDGAGYEEACAALEACEVPAPFRCLTGSATAEAIERLAGAQGGGVGRIAVVNDEAGATFGAVSRYSTSANYEAFLAGHDGGHYSSDRITRESVVLDQLRVPVLLMAQPSAWDLVRSDPQAAGRGLLARFSVVRPPSLVGRRFGWAPLMPEQLSEEWATRTGELLREAFASDEPQVLRLSPGAFRLFGTYRDRVESELLTTYEGDTLNGWAGKLPGRAVRIAGVLHALDHGPSGMIAEVTMRNAISLAEWVSWHGRRELGGADVPPAMSRDAQRLAEALDRLPETFTRREATHALHGWRTDRFMTAARELEALGAVEQLDNRGREWRRTGDALATLSDDETAGRGPSGDVGDAGDAPPRENVPEPDPFSAPSQEAEPPALSEAEAVALLSDRLGAVVVGSCEPEEPPPAPAEATPGEIRSYVASLLAGGPRRVAQVRSRTDRRGWSWDSVMRGVLGLVVVEPRPDGRWWRAVPRLPEQARLPEGASLVEQDDEPPALDDGDALAATGGDEEWVF